MDKNVNISAGKLQGYKRLSDREGRFLMMGIGARDTLRKLLARVAGKSPEDIEYRDMANCKKLIIKNLSSFYSAVSMDPIYGYPSCIKYIPKNTGLILSIEDTGYELSGRKGRERKTSFIAGWNVAKAKRAGADAVKLIIHYRKETSPEIKEHQKKVALLVGEECKKYDILYILEIMSYPLLDEEIEEKANYARKLPEIVLDYVKDFSQSFFGADILKIDFPGDLKYCREFCDGCFDGIKREAIYTLDEVRDYCRKITEISSCPWIILSGGAEIEEFSMKVKLATENGASGFLGGRPLWQDAILFYPDFEKMEQWLMTSGVHNFRKLARACEYATPWFSFKRFGSFANLTLDKEGKDWYKNYSSFPLNTCRVSSNPGLTKIQRKKNEK